MRQASAATASATAVAIACEGASSSTSQGLAMAPNRPTQPPSERSTLTCLVREPIAELHDDGVQVRVIVPERLVADELVGRHVP